MEPTKRNFDIAAIAAAAFVLVVVLVGRVLIPDASADSRNALLAIAIVAVAAIGAVRAMAGRALK